MISVFPHSTENTVTCGFQTRLTQRLATVLIIFESAFINIFFFICDFKTTFAINKSDSYVAVFTVRGVITWRISARAEIRHVITP